MRHTSGGPSRFDREAMPVLLEYVNASAGQTENQIGKAKAYRLADMGPALSEVGDDAWVGKVSKEWKFSRGEIRDAINFAKAEEGQCACLWDFVNGFTASARAIEFMDARFDLEKRAGNLLKLVSES